MGSAFDAFLQKGPALEAAVRGASLEELAAFEGWCRAQSWWGPWITPVISPAGWAAKPPAAVAIETCHPSGFIRQKAVELLSLSHTGIELPFLLFRLNDWVLQVRGAAERAVRARLRPEEAAEWVRCLGLVGRVVGGQRSDHEWLARDVDALLRRPECLPEVEAGLLRGPVAVRRACLRVVAGLPEPARWLQLAVRDRDPITSRFAAERLCTLLEGDALRELLAFLRRGDVRARVLALETICRRLPMEAEPELRAASFDYATVVRELARFHWEKLGLGPVSFLDLYRERLATATGDDLVTALRGLTDLGTGADLPLFAKYASHPSSRVREAAIMGLGRIDGRNQLAALTKALADSSLRVVKAAHRYVRLYFGRDAARGARIPAPTAS